MIYQLKLQLSSQAFELEKYNEHEQSAGDITFEEEERQQRRLEIDISEANVLDSSAQDLSLLSGNMLNGQDSEEETDENDCPNNSSAKRISLSAKELN